MNNTSIVYSIHTLQKIHSKLDIAQKSKKNLISAKLYSNFFFCSDASNCVSDHVILNENRFLPSYNSLPKFVDMISLCQD